MRNDELQAAVFRFEKSVKAGNQSLKNGKANGIPMGRAEIEFHKDMTLALSALREKQQRQPDPITGLVPCGCGGKAKIWLSDFTRFTYLITDYEVGCTECAMTTGWVRGKQENAVKVWNTAMGGVVISSLEKTTVDVDTPSPSTPIEAEP